MLFLLMGILIAAPMPVLAQITLDGIWDCNGRDLKIKETKECAAETEGIFKES